MANIIGKNATFFLSKETLGGAIPTSSSDVNYDLSDADNIAIETLSNEVTLNIESNTDEDTAYADDWEKHEVITGRWSVDVTAYFSTASDEIDELFVKGFFDAITVANHSRKQRFALWPNGKDGANEGSATQPKYMGLVVISQATIDPVRTGVARLRARLMGHGIMFRAVA